MNVAVASSVSDGAAAPRSRLRVMLVDDAVVVRSTLTRWIDEEPDLQVVASVRTGRAAVDQLAAVNPDVVILDVDMPELDGISALPLLLEKKRDLVVIMASALTRRHAEVSIRALTLGAADYIPKPKSDKDGESTAVFRHDLIEKIRELGAKRRRTPPPPITIPSPSIMPSAAPMRPMAEPVESVELPAPSFAGVTLRPFPPTLPRVLLLGASTGGPHALTRIVGGLGDMLAHVPVLVVQHMPPTFTTILAEHLARASGRPAHEARDGEPVIAGHIYVAPGGLHMRVVRDNGTAVIALDDGPLVNYCKPAIDPLFASAAEVWGGWNAAVVLTGMGADGARGAAAIVKAGGSVMAQDEASSVVWGMPGAVTEAGLCSAVLPLDRIAPRLVDLFAGRP